MTVHEMPVSEIGRARNNFIAGFETVYAPGMEPAAGRDMSRAGNVAFEEDMLFLGCGIRHRNIGQ